MELDFMQPLDYWWALLPEIILCVSGMVVLIAGVTRSSPQESAGDPSFSSGADLGWLAFVGVLFAGSKGRLVEL